MRTHFAGLGFRSTNMADLAIAFTATTFKKMEKKCLALQTRLGNEGNNNEEIKAKHAKKDKM